MAVDSGEVQGEDYDYEAISKLVGDEVTSLTFSGKDQSLLTSAPTLAIDT